MQWAYDPNYRGRLRIKRHVKLDDVRERVELGLRKEHLLMQLRLQFLFLTLYFPWVFFQSSVGDCNAVAKATSRLLLQSKFDVRSNLKGNSLLASKSFLEIDSANEYNLWLQQVVYPSFLCPQNNSTDLYVDESNYIIHGIEVRQNRVALASELQCESKIGSQLCNLFATQTKLQQDQHSTGSQQSSSLAFSFREGQEATTAHSFGPGWESHSQGKHDNSTTSRLFYQWHQAEILRGSSIVGTIDSYPGSGFNVSLPRSNCTLARERINEMSDIQQPFIDFQTRAVVTSVTFHNKNLNIDLNSVYLLEFSAFGSVHASQYSQCSPGYLSTSQLGVRLGYSMLVNVLAVLTVVSTLQGIRKATPSIWTFVEIGSGVLYNWQLYLTFQFYTSLQTPNASNDQWELEADIRSRIQLYVSSQKLYSWTVMLEATLLVRSLYIFSGFREVAMGASTALRHLFSVWLILAILLLGYILCGNIAYGTLVPGFESYGETLQTLISVISGKGSVQYLSHFTIFKAFSYWFLVTFCIIFALLLPIVTQAVVFVAWHQNVLAQESGSEMNHIPRVKLLYQWKQIVKLINEGLRNPRQQFVPKFLDICHRLFGTPIPGWLSKQVILHRIKVHVKRNDTHFVDFQELRAVIQGETTGLPFLEVNNAQVDSILAKIPTRYRDDEKQRILQELDNGQQNQRLTHQESDLSILSAMVRVESSLRGLTESQGDSYKQTRQRLDTVLLVLQQALHHVDAANTLLRSRAPESIRRIVK